jgi:tRNA(Ile)-lysidine synthase
MNASDFLLQHIDSTFTPVNSTHIAVAVSGGADSLALCLLLNEWAEIRNIQLTALTVDHQLRPDSTPEAQRVHQWLTHRGIHHETLRWNHSIITSNVQELAREARYALLIEYCKQHNIEHLWLGHHANDQWETFFMRLSHASGVKGLSGMSPHSHRDGITIYRPFLTIDPQILKEYLIHQQQPWINDPSNQLRTYERIRWRDQINTLSQLGVSPKVIHNVCEKLSQDDHALDWSANDWIVRHTTFHPQLLFFECDLALQHLPISLIKRIALRLASQVRGISITTAHVRHNMQSLIQKLTVPHIKAFTFAGCYWMEHQHKVYVLREWEKCPNVCITSTEMTYDHRFNLTSLPIGKTLEPVGKKHWPQIKPLLKESLLPYQVFLSLPIVTSGVTSMTPGLSPGPFSFRSYQVGYGFQYRAERMV